MATEISCVYKGDGQTEITHGPSGAKLITDLPLDNGGKERSISPTDLTAASLASCILTIMGKMAENNYKHNFSGAEIKITKEMQDSPRRIGKFTMQIKLPSHIPAEYIQRYMAAIESCPVHKSIHPDIKVEIIN